MNILHKITTSGKSVPAPFFLAVCLLSGTFAASMAFGQLRTDVATSSSVTLTLTGLYTNPIESSVTPGSMPDPNPCVPCDGDNLHTVEARLRVDVSGVLPLPKEWELQGVYFVIGDDTYWFDVSTDHNLLSRYANGAVDTLIIRDPYGLITGAAGSEVPLGLHFEFQQGVETTWILTWIHFE